MNRDLLVRVFVPTHRNDGGEGEWGKTGTGYPVGNNLILTAHHIVFPERRDNSKPIQIFWQDIGWQTLQDDPAAWPGTVDLDAVLLRCEYPFPVQSPGIVSGDRPRDLQRWLSAGFPEAGHTTEGRRAHSFDGHLYGTSSSDRFFEFVVPTGSPADAEDWAGASGMPLFLAHTNTIIGIARAVPPKFGPQRLSATPCFRLRAAPAFTKALGEPQQSRGVNIRKQVLEAFRGSPLVFDAVRTRVGLHGQDEGAAKPEALADALLSLDRPAALTALSGARNDLEDNLLKSAELAAATKALSAVLQCVMPAVYDPGLVQALAVQKSSPDAPPFSLDCTIWTVAEIIMAAADDRPTQFHPRIHDNDFPHGTRHLPDPPEGGSRELPDIRAGITAALMKKFVIGDWKHMHQRIAGYIIAARVDQSMRADDHAGNVRRANDRLAAQSRANSTFYVLCKMPSDDSLRRELEAGLQKLKQDFPSLAILWLRDDAEQMDREMREYNPFQMMLPQRPAKKTTSR